MPDKASLHLVAIEDRDYKEERIDCEFIFANSLIMFAHCYLSAGDSATMQADIIISLRCLFV